ncbi:MAG: SurA N-terminal domain-containing protein [Pseudomonadota bacterium]
MLEALRASLGTWVAKAFIGLLVASFALWGIADYATSGATSTAVTVGDTKVGVDEYRFAFDRQVLVASQSFGRRLTAEEARAFGVGEQVVSQLVTGAVLEEQARRMNLGISDDQLADTIAGDQAFQDASGAFDTRIFQQTLYNAGLTPNDYIELQKASAVRQQLVAGAVGDVAPPTAFLEALQQHQNEARDVTYITLTPELVGEIGDPDSETLSEFFDATKTAYRAPEYRTVRTLRVTAQDVADLDAISDEGVMDEYERLKPRFTQASQRSVRQIVLNADEAEQATAALASGSDFDAVADTLKKQATDLGTFTQANFPDQNLAETVFTLPSGGTSEVLDGMFGSVIFSVEETRAEIVESFEGVRDVLREELAVYEAGEQLSGVFEAIEDARASGKTLEEIAGEQSIEIVNATFDANGNTQDDTPATIILSAAELLGVTFETEVGIETDPLRLEGTDTNPGAEGYLWYEVTDIAEARERTLDEVQERVLADWKTDRASELLRATADGLLRRAQRGADLAALAEPLGLEVQTATAVRRQARDSGLSEPALISAFDGATGKIAVSSGQNENNLVLLQATDTASAADPDLPEDIVARVEETVADDLFSQMVQRLQSELQPQVNRQSIEAVFAPAQHGQRY